jgi:uncharacterized protein YchJ
MDTRTGEIWPQEHIDAMSADMQKNFIPVSRDLSEEEKLAKQIMLYETCGCGSGKKFKFCCHTPK